MKSYRWVAQVKFLLDSRSANGVSLEVYLSMALITNLYAFRFANRISSHRTCKIERSVDFVRMSHVLYHEKHCVIRTYYSAYCGVPDHICLSLRTKSHDTKLMAGPFDRRGFPTL